MPEECMQLRIANKPDEFIPMYKNAWDKIRRELLITLSKELPQGDQAQLRNKVTPTAPAKFLAVFDGRTFTFRLTIGSSIKKDIDKLDFEKLPVAAKDKALIQLKKLGMRNCDPKKK